MTFGAIKKPKWQCKKRFYYSIVIQTDKQYQHAYAYRP